MSAVVTTETEEGITIEAKCDELNSLYRIDEERIIICGNETFIIIACCIGCLL